jgi:hypothetical protein
LPLGEYMYVSTPTCFVCHKSSQVYVKVTEYLAWKEGANIQTVMSNDAIEREQLLTGTHGPCFDSAFEDIDEPEDDENI